MSTDRKLYKLTYYRILKNMRKFLIRLNLQLAARIQNNMYCTQETRDADFYRVKVIL